MSPYINGHFNVGYNVRTICKKITILSDFFRYYINNLTSIMSYVLYLYHQVSPDIYDMNNNSHFLPQMNCPVEGDIFLCIMCYIIHFFVGINGS